MKSQKQAQRRVAPWLVLMASSTVCSMAYCDSARAAPRAEVYGRVVVGVNYQSDIAQPDGRTNSLVRGAGNRWGTSLVGLRGTEDLGDDLEALFVLETGFSSNNGNLNTPLPTLFNRRAYVGISGRAGILKAGKDEFINNDVYFLDPTGQEGIGSANLVRGRNGLDANHMITYTTPIWKGWSVMMQTSLGDQFGALNKNRWDGISVTYKHANFEVRTIYDNVRDSNGRYSSLFKTSREWIVGGTATFGALKLFAAYENLHAPDAGVDAPSRAHHYWVGAKYDLTPNLNLVGAAFRVNLNQGGGSANLFMLGTNYYLSKRTVLYTAVGLVRNGGKADFSVEGCLNGPLPGQSQGGVYFGMAYDF